MNTRLDLPLLARGSIGLDRLFGEAEKTFQNSLSNGFPPYNIVLKDENTYVVTLAVAGFSNENIEIMQERNKLRVMGTAPEMGDVTYLHKGIAARSFTREFALDNHVHVEDATLENGMLTIMLVREVPEELQPKKIAISKRS